MMALRVLHVIDNLGQGGVQRYLFGYLSHMDRKKVIFDFVVQTENVGSLEEEVCSLGSKVYHLPSSINEREAFRKRFDSIIHEGGYTIVEAHQNHRCLYPLLLAKRAGVPVRIAHSHSSYPASSIIKAAYRFYFKTRIPWVATELWGCSDCANRWLYGNRSLKKAVIVPNAIDAKRFLFNEENRHAVRSEYKIEGPCVGHVGAGGAAKNYPFILDLFKEIAERDASARLLLVGCSASSQNGALGDEAAKRGVIDKVIFTGPVSDPEKYLSAMDAFVLPSLFEGFPIALLEAQANGLNPITAAGVVTAEVNVSGRVRYIPNGTINIHEWVDAVMAQVRVPRALMDNSVLNSGYDIVGASNALQERYLKLGGLTGREKASNNT